jgi:hypothetical protein
MYIRSFLAVAVGALAFAAATGAAVAYDRHVTIHNNASIVMNEFYASNVGTDDYEENILDGDVIRPGEKTDVNIDDGSGYCKYDFMAVFTDGSKGKQDGVNVCAVSDFYFTD